MRKSFLALSLLTATSAFANNEASTETNLHANDFKWMQFNLMHVVDEKPGDMNHTYIEMEFGGRSGIFDLYSYVDLFDITNSAKSEKHGSERLFVKFNPRLSLNRATTLDLSADPITELFIASENIIGGGGSLPKNFNNYVTKWGLGANVAVPWLGTVGTNLYSRYDLVANEFDGYQFSINWFKPFHNFANGSFISYQGYLDYEFALNNTHSSSDGLATFHGIYWHSDRYAVGYGLKLYKDVYGIKDTTAFASTGASHYASVTYKF